jgi:hypothetical protein
MVTVDVMQVPVDEIIGVVTVRNGLVAAAGTVAMSFVVGPASVLRGAIGGILPAYIDHMLIDVTVVEMVQVPIVKVIGVTVVKHCGVAAATTMRVAVPFVGSMCRH